MTLQCYPDLSCTILTKNMDTEQSYQQNISDWVFLKVFLQTSYNSGTSRNLNFLHEYENNNHMKNVCRFALCNDIETNPGPAIFHINPSKTVSAPYNQGNQIIFGETAGQQCLAMCLCALIYNKRQEISSPQDLIQVMNIGNELYSKLSHLARQSFLMFSELPSYLTVFGYTAFILTIDSNYLLISLYLAILHLY